MHGENGTRERGRRGRTVWAALGAAPLVGLGAGLVARLLMRLITLVIGVNAAFSVAGMVGILIVFVVLAIPAAVTATARPAIRHGGRWVTAMVTGWASARTGFADARSILLVDEGRLPLLAALAVAFAVLVVAHGRLTQRVTRRLAGGE